MYRKSSFILLILILQNSALICMETDWILEGQQPLSEAMLDYLLNKSFHQLQQSKSSLELPIRNESAASIPITPPLDCEKWYETKQDEDIIRIKKEIPIDEIKKNSIKILLRRTQMRNRCPVVGCHKTFSTQKELKNHDARNHRTEKPFSCDQANCPKCYSTKSSLDLHKIRIHHEKRYQCFLGCDEKYAVRGDLNQHLKRRHKYKYFIADAMQRSKAMLQE